MERDDEHQRIAVVTQTKIPVKRNDPEVGVRTITVGDEVVTDTFSSSFFMITSVLRSFS